MKWFLIPDHNLRKTLSFFFSPCNNFTLEEVWKNSLMTLLWHSSSDWVKSLGHLWSILIILIYDFNFLLHFISSLGKIKPTLISEKSTPISLRYQEKSHLYYFQDRSSLCFWLFYAMIESITESCVILRPLVRKDKESVISKYCKCWSHECSSMQIDCFYRTGISDYLRDFTTE